MIDIVVIVILLGLLVAVLTASIPPRQEGLPEYHFKRIPKPDKTANGGDAGADAQTRAASAAGVDGRGS